MSAAAAGVVACSASENGAPPIPEAWSNVRIRHRQTAVAVASALGGAWRRLGQERCRELLSDFDDATGQPLQQILDGLGQTSQEYLGSILFYDGSKRPACAREGVAATTSPHGRVVFICPNTFRALQKSNRLGAEVIIIHEMLHSLGLGEDPPSSWQISHAVYRQCTGGR